MRNVLISPAEIVAVPHTAQRIMDGSAGVTSQSIATLAEAIDNKGFYAVRFGSAGKNSLNLDVFPFEVAAQRKVPMDCYLIEAWSPSLRHRLDLRVEIPMLLEATSENCYGIT